MKERTILFLAVMAAAAVAMADVRQTSAAVARHEAVVVENYIETEEYVSSIPIATKDPSLCAVSNDYETAKFKPHLERYRIVEDLNGDGVKDLILSDPEDEYGKIESWSVYFRTNSVWRFQGNLIFSPSKVTFERLFNGVRIWTLLGYGGQEVGLGYYCIKDGKFDRHLAKLDMKYENRGEGVVWDILKTVFGRPGTYPLRMEKSTTSASGVVTWKFVPDQARLGFTDEVADLKRRLVAAAKRADAAEERLRALQGRIGAYERGVREIYGVTLGEKWSGGATNRVCGEVFSGFTNMTVAVDAQGYVEAVRLTRPGRIPDDASETAWDTLFTPTDEEKKVIHQVENRFHIRLRADFTTGQYVWKSVFEGDHVRVQFAHPANRCAESAIEVRYVRKAN